MAARAGRPLFAGTPAADVIAEIGRDERDLVVTRAGGLGPMHDTGLESLLRRLGIHTVVVAGVSVNVAILAGRRHPAESQSHHHAERSRYFARTASQLF